MKQIFQKFPIFAKNQSMSSTTQWALPEQGRSFALYLVIFLVVMGLISGCNSASAQSVKKPKVDTTAPSIIQPTDSTMLLTYKDFQELSQAILGDVPAKYANPITNWLQQRFQQRAQEYALKPKK
jgi:hypothetical protein